MPENVSYLNWNTRSLVKGFKEDDELLFETVSCKRNNKEKRLLQKSCFNWLDTIDSYNCFIFGELVELLFFFCDKKSLIKYAYGIFKLIGNLQNNLAFVSKLAWPVGSQLNSDKLISPAVHC